MSTLNIGLHLNWRSCCLLFLLFPLILSSSSPSTFFISPLHFLPNPPSPTPYHHYQHPYIMLNSQHTTGLPTQAKLEREKERLGGIDCERPTFFLTILAPNYSLPSNHLNQSYTIKVTWANLLYSSSRCKFVIKKVGKLKFLLLILSKLIKK